MRKKEEKLVGDYRYIFHEATKETLATFVKQRVNTAKKRRKPSRTAMPPKRTRRP